MYIFGFYIHAFNWIIFRVVSLLLFFSCFNDYYMRLMLLNVYANIILLMLLVLTFCILYICRIKLLLVGEVDRTAVGCLCLCEVKYSVENILKLFNSCYHMVVSSNEVSLSIFEDIRMKTVQDSNWSYNVAIQAINRSKRSTFQELFICPER